MSKTRFTDELSRPVSAAAARAAGDAAGKTGEINRLLLKLRFNPRLKGFRYLRDAIGRALDFPPGRCSLKYGVYPRLSERYGVTPGVLERDMANAVDAAFLCADLGEVERIFGNAISAEKGKPTLKELIATLCGHILIREGEAVF